MASRRSIASLLIFVGSALCFFFPFVTISCGGVSVLTLSGQQLATGTTLQQPQAFGPPQSRPISADPFAAVAFLSAIAGVVVSLVGRRLAGATALSGGVGAISLVIMKSRLDAQLQAEGQGLVKATYETGFTLALLSLLVGAAWNLYLFQRTELAVETTQPLPLSRDRGEHGADVPGSSAPSPEQE